MSTLTMQQNCLYGLGEGGNVADATYLTYALRWINISYRDLFLRYRFKNIQKRSVFRTADGQQTYQAPSNFMGFLTLKDETSDTIIDQITPEEFAREVGTTKVLDETFTSNHDTAVSLDNKAILQYSETINDDAAQTTTYVKDTDYTLSYTSGTITVDSTGSMSDATTYYANYLHYTKGDPIQFCMEFDATNGKYVFRLDPVPDGIKIASIVYPSLPSALSSSVEPIWSQLEFALERGGIYYGSLEIVQDPQLRMEFKSNYETALQAVMQLDRDLLPKHDRIPVIMKKSDYTDRTTTG